MGVKVTILSSVSAQKRMTKASSQTPDGLTFIAFSDGYDDGLKLSDNQEHYLSEHKRRGSKALSELIKASSEEGCPVTGFKEQRDALIAEINPKILVDTFDALESKALRAIGKHNLIAIGPLVPSAFLDGKDPSDNAFGRRSITKIKRLCRVVGFEASIIGSVHFVWKLL
ncbi:hypothetical protein CsSME_00034197 [Camellia sinensis var. sinensis]